MKKLVVLTNINTRFNANKIKKKLKEWGYTWEYNLPIKNSSYYHTYEDNTIYIIDIENKSVCFSHKDFPPKKDSYIEITTTNFLLEYKEEGDFYGKL